MFYSSCYTRAFLVSKESDIYCAEEQQNKKRVLPYIAVGK